MRSAGTIRSNLTKILIGALVPMLFLGLWQGALTYEDSRNLVAQRLRANAWGIAESERDPFIIARHSLQMLAQLDTMRRSGPGCDQLLVDAQDGATGIINFVRADRTGAVRCSALPFEPGQSLAGNRWWQKATMGNSFLLGGPTLGEVSKRLVVILYLPLRDERGRSDGTIGAGISLDRLSSALKARQRELGGVVMLIDRTGEIILSAGPSRFAGLSGVAEGLQAPQQAVSTDGKEWTFVTAPIFDRDLMVVYAEPRDNFTNAALSRIWLILALPLLAAGLSLAGVWFATQRYLLDWFPRLHRLIQRIGEGRPLEGVEAFANAPTEIVGMADDLQRMSGTLRLNRAALEAALETQKSLTRELNHRVRNNIQIIVSLLTMQAEKVPQGWVRDMLEQARARVSAIGLVHRFMYDQAEDRNGRLSVAQLLADLCGQIRNSNRHAPELDLQVDADATCRLSFDRAVPMMLFALEAIGSAVPADAAGRIMVRLTAGRDGCRLEISDNIPAAGAPLADSALLEALAEQVSGRLGVARDADGGRTWLEFPAD